MSDLIWGVRNVIRKFPLIPYLPRASTKLLIISEDNKVSNSQIYPFYFYRADLFKEFGLDFRHISFDDILAATKPMCQPDVVVLQFWFDRSIDEINTACEKIRKFWPRAKFSYFDAFAPVDLRFAEVLNKYIDFYCKKNILKNRDDYFKSTEGDTNLSDWYGKRYRLVQPVVKFEIPPGFFDKLIVAPSFSLSPGLLSLFISKKGLGTGEKIFNLHSRLGLGQGEGWYATMRREAEQAVKNLKNTRVTENGFIKNHLYLKELMASEACFSPFGYGEVCWRDFEAFACGSVLIKPKMNHMEVDYEAFVPWETYVPIEWDFSDLQAAVDFVRNDPVARNRISSNSFEAVNDYLNDKKFMLFVQKII